MVPDGILTLEKAVLTVCKVMLKHCNSYGPFNFGRNEPTIAKNYKFF